MLAQRGYLYLFNVDSVYKDLALLNIVISADKTENSGFSASRSTDKRNRVTSIYLE